MGVYQTANYYVAGYTKDVLRASEFVKGLTKKRGHRGAYSIQG